MSLFRVKYLSFFFILISVFSFFNIIYSYYFNLYLNLNTYYFSLISSLIIGILFYKFKEIYSKPTIFESVSGFTSTGFTIFDNIKHIDQGLILWRSSIQWIGGLYFLFSIIFLILFILIILIYI